MRGRARGRAAPLAVVAAALLAGAGPTAAQPENPVYVDDSPRAWELFRQARDHARDNVGEAVRLYRELLDDYAMKLLPVNEAAADHFVAVRARVLTELAGDQRLLELFRLRERAEASRLLEAGQWQRVAVTRSLTEPGLEALLCLAQQDLEAARFHAALDWLWQAVDHPDLDGRRAAHCWFMIGAAAVYLGRPDALADAWAGLEALGADGGELRAELDRLSAAEAPPPPKGVSTLDRAPAAELERLVAQPIWSMTLRDTPLSRRIPDRVRGELSNRRQVDQMRRSGALLTSAPTVVGSAVYLNEGRTIHAVDRFTGRALWRPFVERRIPAAMEKTSRQIADLNVVVTSGDVLVTITGHAFADAAKSERTVVCLDARDGRLRWKSRIDRLSPADELEGLFPHGAPLIGEGMVYVMARKVSRQLLTSCYVIALDLSDGRLRWARHVASSGGIRSRFARPFSSPVYHDGDLAVATAIGAVARIDATTGQTRWLRRYHPPLSPYLAERRPWEISGPVVTPRGVVAVRPDHRRIVMLDWESGNDIDSAPSTGREAWNSPRYLLADGQTVYGVGGEIRAFHIEALQQPMWTFPPSPPLDGRRDGVDSADVEIRGRVQLIPGGLIVPTARGLVILDADTGAVAHRVDMESVGNPLAAGPQLILADSDTLQAYMPLDRAQQMLRQQIAAGPRDPTPALALMRLGVRVRDLDLALEAAELVIRAINAAAADEPTAQARSELFATLLDLHHERIAETVDQGESLHAMIGIVAQEPEQRVEHLLAYGDWLSDHALGAAVEAYQAVLSRPEIQQADRREAGLSRPAAAWAAQRIGRLIDAHGPGVYGPQADFARERLAQLRRGPQASPEALVALAREFPFADASLEAARSAAEAWQATGEARRGLGALADLYRLAPDEKRAAALLGRLAAGCQAAGWEAQTAAVLRYVVDTYGAIDLDTAAGNRDAGAWLAILGADASPGRLPRAGEKGGTAVRLPGMLVPMHPAIATMPPTDRVLIFDPPKLALLAGDALQEQWSIELGIVGEPYLLRFDDEGILLWVEVPGDDAAVVMLAADGSKQWVTESINELIGEPQRRVGGPAGSQLLPRGEPFNPNQLVGLISGDRLLVVRRSGEVAAIALADGKTQRWRRLKPLSLVEVHRVLVTEFAVALAGGRRSVSGGRELAPVIVLLDPVTGETLDEIEPRGTVRWIMTGPLGALVYGDDRGIEAYDVLSGRRVWTDTGPEAMGTPHAIPVDGYIVVESAVTRAGEGPNPLWGIRVVDGVREGPFDTPARGEWDRLDLRELVVTEGRIFARYGMRIVRFSATGAVLGADVVSDQRDYKWLLPMEERLLVVSRFKSEQVMLPAESRRQTQHTYRVYGMSENCRLMGEPVQLPPLNERLERAAVVDGWLVLSTSTATLAVPLAP